MPERIRLLGAPLDTVTLMFVADSLPPATFGIVTTGWVPTLDLTAYVRALPEPFRAVGLWYRDFGETGDEEVTALLAAANRHARPESNAASRSSDDPLEVLRQSGRRVPPTRSPGRSGS